MMRLPAVAWLALAMAAQAASATEMSLPLEYPIELEVRHHAQLVLKTQGIRRVQIFYETAGYFGVYCSPVPVDPRPGWQPQALFNQGVSVFPGQGSCTFDPRRSIDWQPAAHVLLVFRGTGRFVIREVVADILEPSASPAAEKRWAMFWAPERVRHTTINSLTPVYWDLQTPLAWTQFWGIFTTSVLVLAGAAALVWKPLRRPDRIVLIACACLLTCQAQWLTRSWPMFNKSIWMSTDDRIRLNYFEPEFGELAVKARELIPQQATVLVAGRPNDWFSPQTLAFNLAPRRCGYSPDEKGRLLGIGGYTAIEAKKAEYYVSFYGDSTEPAGFTRIYELHPQAYIAQRKTPQR